MHFKPTITLSLLLFTGHLAAPAQATSVAPAPTPAVWLLAFNGKSTNALANDKRFPHFLRTHITNRKLSYWIGKPTSPAADAREFLGGPPNDVHVSDHRYLTASACVPHSCPDRGLLWVDTTTGATIFAASIYATATPILGNRAHLWLFTNTPLQQTALPPTLTSAIAQWSGEPNGDNTHTIITDITLVQPDGTQTKLSPGDVHAWEPSTPATGSQKPGK